MSLFTLRYMDVYILLSRFFLNFSFASWKLNIFSNFSFSSRNWAEKIEISLSPLETGQMNSDFSFFSSRNWTKEILISLSPLETRRRNSDFSSRNCWKGIQISLSPLECGKIVFLSFSFSSRLDFLHLVNAWPPCKKILFYRFLKCLLTPHPIVL